MRCATPGPCSSQPQGHKTAFKFQRIRCTICFTSPDNHQKKKDHTCKSCACLMHVSCNDCKSCCEKTKFQVVQNSFTLKRKQFTRFPRTSGTAGLHQKLAKNRKANCFALLKRITKLKCVNSEFKSVDIDPNWGCLKLPYGTMSESP